MFFSTRYRRELERRPSARQSSGSWITQTTLGAIEQLTFGEGPPVLLVHGVVGGADQGRALAGAYFGDGFKVVAVSRFGYVRSPLPVESSPRAQANWYAACLMSLASARSRWLALRQARRRASVCSQARGSVFSARALFDGIPPYPIPPTPVRRLVRAFCRSEFLFWVMF